MRLTIDLLRKAPQFTNTLLQREVDLRGLSLSSLDENALLLLENRFDVINFTSNALTSLEYFPLRTPGSVRNATMDRLVTLIAHRNQIQKVSIGSCAMALPNMRHFLADHNNLKTVKDLYFLKFWRKLEIISLQFNPLWNSNPENYDEAKLRAFLVFLCPCLKLINYTRVTHKDRQASTKHKEEFKHLVAQWESMFLSASPSGSGREAGVTKHRKRGRDARAAAIAATNDSSVAGMIGRTDTDAKVFETALPIRKVGGEEDEEDYQNLQERLAQLEAKILADDTTPEEISALEQEFNEITAMVERVKKRRKV